MNLRVSALLPLLLALMLTLTTEVCRANPASMVLSIGERFTDDGGSCELPLKPGEPSLVPIAPLNITEADVVGWSGTRIVLDSRRYPPEQAERLMDRCFVLAVNGRHVGSGVVLSVSSPRLTSYPTLNIIGQGLWLALQFTSGNHRNIRSIYSSELSEVLDVSVKPRFALWIGESIGTTDASQCAAKLKLPTLKPRLVETDIVAWRRQTNTMTIDPGRLGGASLLQADLVDHCFVLAVEGQPAVSGVMLSARSARLVDFPALVVAPDGQHVSLQLRPGFPAQGQVLLNDALDRVLQERPAQVTGR